MNSGMFDGIVYVFWGLLIAAFFGIGGCTYSIIISLENDDIIPVIGNSIENLEALKNVCEQSMPRDQECVMVYEFVPAKTGEAK